MRARNVIDEAYLSTPTQNEKSVKDHEEAIEAINETCRSVHNGRVGHNRAARTWNLLNKQYPEYSIPFKMVQDFIIAPTC